MPFGDINFLPTVAQYPAAASLLFVVILILFFLALSGGGALRNLGGIVRSLATVFSTPFAFLRNALGIIGNARADEKDYAGTRVFVLFRYSRLQYLGVLLFSLVYFAGGVSASILAFVPRYETEQAAALQSQIGDANRQIAAASSASSSQGNLAALQSRYRTAGAAYQAQATATAALRANIGATSPQLTAVDSAQDAASLAIISDSLPAYFADCPTGPNWQNFTVELCDQFRSRLTRYVAGRVRELSLLAAYNAAKTDADNATQSQSEQSQQLAQLNANLSDLQQQYKQVDPSNGAWIAPHLRTTAGMLTITLASLIAWIWVAAIIIDIINWLILLMRSLEKTHAARLSGG